MTLGVWLTGLLVITAVAATGHVMTSKKRVNKSMAEMATSVQQLITPDVEAWLRPQLTRRDRWIGVVTICGWLPSGFYLVSDLPEIPWYWFAVLLGLGAGAMIGSFAAGYQTFPCVDSSVRTVSPRRREVADYVDCREFDSMRLAVPMPFLAMALAAAVAITGRRDLGVLTLVMSAVAAVLVVTSLVVQRVLVSRPMVSSTTAGLVWQEALLKTTVESMPRDVRLIGWFSSGVGLYTLWAARENLPWWVTLAGVLFLLFSVTAVVLRHRPDGEAMSSSRETRAPALW